MYVFTKTLTKAKAKEIKVNRNLKKNVRTKPIYPTERI